MKSPSKIKYVYVTQWYDNLKVGTIHELVENPSGWVPEKRFTVKSGLLRRWISTDCGIVITKEENPERFL